MAEEAEKKEGEGEETEAAPPKKSKKKLIIIIAVVVILAGAGGAFAMLGGKAEKPAEGEEAPLEEEVHYATVELDPFIVNLSENSSFLKLKILVEYDPKVVEGHHDGESGGSGGGGGHGGGGAGGGEAGGLPGVLGEKEPMIRDAIIRVLSSKKAEQVLSQEGKEELKDELIEAINEATGLDEPAVVAVYFTEFIVQ